MTTQLKRTLAIFESRAAKSRPSAGDNMTLEMFAEGALLPPVEDELNQLPEWSSKFRGVPNAILRSALFAAVNPGLRRHMKRELVQAEDGLEIRFSGMQLDQSDLDLWETLVHISRHTPCGDRFYFKPHQVLSHMGRSSGGEQFTWLAESLDRMVACSVNITVAGLFTYSNNMLEIWTDEVTKERAVVLNKKLLSLYSQGWTEVNWAQRDALRKKPLALWLHGWYSTQSVPEDITVEEIYHRCGSHSKSIKSFKGCLRQAMKDIQAVGAIRDHVISRSGTIQVSKSLTQSLPGLWD